MGSVDPACACLVASPRAAVGSPPRERVAKKEKKESRPARAQVSAPDGGQAGECLCPRGHAVRRAKIGN